MSDIVAFLKARLNEDEETARAVQTRSPWRYVPMYPNLPSTAPGADTPIEWAVDGAPMRWAEEADGSMAFEPVDTFEGAALTSEVISEDVVDSSMDYPHIARWDPARVLREVEAKRAIVAAHFRAGHGVCAEGCHERAPGVWQTWPCQTLRILAAVYYDHPDYDPAWALE